MRLNKTIYTPLLIFIAAIIFWGIFFFNGDGKFDKMVSDFTARQINGTITFSSEKGRGFYLLEINDKVSDTDLKFSVPKSWFFKENNIQVGDSVSKEANSKKMTFFKNSDGSFEKCCEYEIGM